MSKPHDRSVYQLDNGKWANKRNDATRPTSTHDTQKEANDAAAEGLRKSGGGERTTMGRDGRINSKDTIGGNDPRSIRDTEH